MAFDANPIAARRTADLVVDIHGDETVVLDTRTDAVHCLPLEIATVWNACDGTRSAADLAQVTGLNRDIVDSSIEQLLDVELLSAPGMDRRKFLRRSVLVGGSLAVAPLIQSIVSPAVNAAASTTPTPCHASVVVNSCSGNKANYTFTVGGLTPGTSYNVIITYKNQSVTDNFVVIADASGNATHSQQSGAAVPHSQVASVDIKIYNAATGVLVCEDFAAPFAGC